MIAIKVYISRESCGKIKRNVMVFTIPALNRIGEPGLLEKWGIGFAVFIVSDGEGDSIVNHPTQHLKTLNFKGIESNFEMYHMLLNMNVLSEA